MFKLPFALINTACGSLARQYIFQCVYVCTCKIKRGQIIFWAAFSMVSYVSIPAQGSEKQHMWLSCRKQSKHNVTNPYWLPDASKCSGLAVNYCFLWSVSTLPSDAFPFDALWPPCKGNAFCSVLLDRWMVVPTRNLKSQPTRLSLVIPQKDGNWLAKANGFWQVVNWT